MKRIALVACCLMLLVPGARSLAAQDADAEVRSGLEVMRTLVAKGDLKGVRREGKRLLASFPGASGAVEARLLLGAADCSLGFYDEAKSVLAPILEGAPASPEKREALLIVAEANRSKGGYAEAAANLLGALSMKPDEKQRAAARAALAELAGLLSQDERRDLGARFVSADGVDLVAGPAPEGKGAAEPAGRRMGGEPAPAREAAQPSRPLTGLRSFPVAVKGRKGGAGTLRIGVLCPLEGRFAPLGESFLRGASVALREARAKGTKNVELVVGDTRGSPILCRSVAERLVREQRVDALLGEVLSSSTIAAAHVAEISKTVLLSPVATEEGIDEIGEYVFQTTAGSEVETAAIARMACDRLGLRRVAFMSSDDPDSRRRALLFRSEVEREGGELCVAEFYPEGTTDFSESIDRVRAAAPEALFIASDTEDLVLILPQLSFHELGVQLLGTSVWSSKRLVRMAAKHLEGAVFPADIESQDGERLFTAACAAVKEPVGEVNQVVIGGYNGTRLLIQALAKSAAGGATLRDELARQFDRRRHPFLDYLSGGGIPFYTVRGERLVEFETLKARR